MSWPDDLGDHLNPDLTGIVDLDVATLDLGRTNLLGDAGAGDVGGVEADLDPPDIGQRPCRLDAGTRGLGGVPAPSSIAADPVANFDRAWSDPSNQRTTTDQFVGCPLDHMKRVALVGLPLLQRASDELVEMGFGRGLGTSPVHELLEFGQAGNDRLGEGGDTTGDDLVQPQPLGDKPFSRAMDVRQERPRRESR